MRIPFALIIFCSAVSGHAVAQSEQPQPGNAAVPTQPDTRSAVATTTSMDNLDNSRELLIGDVLSFRIVEDEKEVTKIVVTDSGEIDVPYIGLVPAKGKTCKMIATTIKQQLEKEFYHKATVIIGLNYNLYGSRSISTAPRGTVASTNPAVRARTQLRAKDGFTIMGMIAGAGIYEIAEDSGDEFLLSHAVLRAGGLKPFANDRKVRVIRADGDKRKTITVNLRDIMKHGELEKDIPIMRGDVIIVDRRTFNF